MKTMSQKQLRRRKETTMTEIGVVRLIIFFFLVGVGLYFIYSRRGKKVVKDIKEQVKDDVIPTLKETTEEIKNSLNKQE